MTCGHAEVSRANFAGTMPIDPKDRVPEGTEAAMFRTIGWLVVAAQGAAVLYLGNVRRG